MLKIDLIKGQYMSLFRTALERNTGYRPTMNDMLFSKKSAIYVANDISTEGFVDEVGEKIGDVADAIKTKYELVRSNSNRNLKRMIVIRSMLRNRIRLKENAPDIQLHSYDKWLCTKNVIANTFEILENELVRILEICTLFYTEHLTASNKLLTYMADVFLKEAIVDLDKALDKLVPSSDTFCPEEFKRLLIHKRTDIVGLTVKRGMPVSVSDPYLGNWIMASANGDYKDCNLILPAIINDEKHLVTSSHIAPLNKDEIDKLLDIITNIIEVNMNLQKETNTIRALDNITEAMDKFERMHNDDESFNMDKDALVGYAMALKSIDEIYSYSNLDTNIEAVNSAILYVCEASVRMME